MDQLTAFLDAHDHYLIITHARPDGDTLGSASGLCLTLRALGKTAFVAPNPEVTPKYRPFVEELTAREGYAYQTVVTVDTASRELMPEPYRNLTVDCRIDHHPSAGGYARLEYVDSACAACGELIWFLAEALGVTVTAEIAKPLYLAISTDTACFRHANTTARTHRVAGALMETGFQRYALDEMIFSSRSRARVALEAAASQELRFFGGGRIAVSVIRQELIQSIGALEDDMENISSMPRQVEGVKIGVTVREEQDKCKISLRTAAPYAANRICAALGGGGHDRASGCTVKTGPKEAEAAVMSVIKDLYPELFL